MIKIQAILFQYPTKVRTDHWKKEDDKPPKKISKDEWFKLYNTPGVEILPPITKE